MSPYGMNQRPVVALVLAGTFALCSACEEEQRAGGPSALDGSDTQGSSLGGASGSSTGGEAGGGPAGNAGAGSSVGSGGIAGAGGGTGGSGAELGALPVDVVPDGECVPKGGTSKEVYPADLPAPNLDRLDTVGARRIAGGAAACGVFTMELDGSSPSQDPISVAAGCNLFAGEGDTFGLVGADQALLFRRHDALGAPTLEPVVLAEDAPGVMAIAGRGGASLVAWALEGTIYARGVDSDGNPAGPAFEVATEAYESTVGLHATASDSGFALVWTGDDAYGRYRTRIAFASLEAVVASPLVIILTPVRHAVIKLVRVEGGFVMAVAGAPPQSPYYLMSLDHEGFVLGSGKELAGIEVVGDLAGLGAEAGVVASRPTGEPVFRAFDTELEPLGPWVCLDEPSGALGLTALSADGAGYAALYSTATGAAVLARFDRLGSGP